uniref:Uncharacterized protein n=1 Tax=Ditylenchus dipsaci TaxID=166011 RepID=A0A915CYH4_9BILA
MEFCGKEFCGKEFAERSVRKGVCGKECAERSFAERSVRKGVCGKEFCGKEFAERSCALNGYVPDNKSLLSSPAVQSLLLATAKLQGPDFANAVANLPTLLTILSVKSTPVTES